MKAAFDAVDARVAKIAKEVKQLGKDAEESAKKFDRQLQASLSGFVKRESLLSSAEKAIAKNTPGSVTNLNNQQALAKSKRSAIEYKASLDEASTSVEALGARLNQLNRRIALTGGPNGTGSRASVRKALETEEAIKDLNSLERKMKEIEGRARVGGLNISGTKSSVNAASNQLFTTLTDPKSSSKKITADMLAYRDAVARATIEVRELAAAERARGAGSKGSSILPSGGLGTVFARTAAYGGAGAALFGAINVLRDGAKFAIEFEDEMARLQAISNSTDTQMISLKKSILEVGSSSRFAIVDLIKISETLAQAGVSAGQMKQVLGAVTSLATASGSTPDEAVQLVTSALGSFQLQATETGRVADLMTSALNRTKLTIQQTGQAIQYVGATAYEQNITLEQLLATVGAVAQAGIKSGSTIGTGFRQFLVDLQAPSEKLTEQLKLLKLTSGDVDVSVRGLPAVLDTLKQAGFGAGQAYAGLETRAAAFYLVAKNNVDVMDELQLSFATSGAAAKANERAMDSLSAQWQRFKNIIGDNLSEEVSRVTVVLKELVRFASDSVESGSFGQTLKSSLVQVAPEALGLVSLFNTLADKLRGTTAESERLATASAEVSEKIQAQQDKIGGLDKEITRLLTQQDTLAGRSTLLAAETVSLSDRFQGLAKYLLNTKGEVLDLVSAMQQLRNEENQTLRQGYIEQGVKAASQRVDAQKTVNSQLRGVRGNDWLMNSLLGNETKALGNLGDPRNIALLRDAADRIEKLSVENAQQLRKLILAQGVVTQATSTERISRIQEQDAGARNSDIGKQFSAKFDQVQPLLDKLSSATDVNKASIRSQVTKILDEIEKIAKDRIPLATSDTSKRFLSAALLDVKSFRQSVEASSAETDQARRAREKAEREANRDANQPLITRQAIIDGFKIVAPYLKAGSGSRDARTQNGLFAAGKTNLDAAHSPHSQPGGNGQDFPFKAETAEAGKREALRIQNALRAQGYSKITVIYETGKGQRQGTGPHFHTSTPVGQRFAAGHDPNAADADGRSQVKTDKLGLATADAALRDNLDDLKYSTSEAVFDAGTKAAKAALDVWADKLREVTDGELANEGASIDTVAERHAEIEEKIRQRTKDFNDAIFDGILKNIDRQMDQIQREFDESLRPAQGRLSIAQGRLSGLGYASNSGKVPDFVQQLSERRVGQAQENLDKETSADLGVQIVKQQALLVRAKADLQRAADSGGQTETATAKVNELAISIAKLTEQKNNLDAALGEGSLLPTTFSVGLTQAIEAYKEASGLNRSFTQDILQNMTPALTTAHQGITTFFTDIMSGSRTVLGAFGDFVKGMVKYFEELAAQALAKGIFNLILGAIGGATAPGGGGAGSAAAAGSHAPFLKGGMVTAISGRYIRNGVPNRDSVHAKIAKGEFVQRKWAVDSVGPEFMQKLNDQGARALQGLGGNAVIAPPARQETNVYVVQEGQRPTMGPNDVIVAVANDILSGGETKKLIRHVAQGG